MRFALTRLFGTILFICAFALSAQAQTYPSRTDLPVTDDAEMLDAETEARVTARIAEIEATHGGRIEVVTLISQALYTGGDDMEVYARGLMESWGLLEDPGKSVLLLIFRDDRALTIQTGPAYAETDSTAIAAIINDVMGPQLANDQPGAAVEVGIDAIAARIVAPAVSAVTGAGVAPEATTETPAETAAEPAAGTEAQGGGSALYWVLGGIAAVVAGIVAMVRRNAAKLAATPCPSCGKTGLRVERVTVQQATAKVEGKGETRTICPSCNHVTAVPYSIAKVQVDPKAKPAPAKAPGSTSDGSGASGKW